MASINNPKTLKVFLDGETRRISRASVASFDDLKTLLASFWGKHDFVLQYTDEDGDIVTVSSDFDLKEALAVAAESFADAPVFRLTAFKSLKLLRANIGNLKAKEDDKNKQPSLPVHDGVECDKSGMNPIVGARYSVQGANYDVCESEFAKLPEAERMLFVKIDHPGAAPMPCGERSGEPTPRTAGCQHPIAMILNRHPFVAGGYRPRGHRWRQQHHRHQQHHQHQQQERRAQAANAAMASEHDAAAAGCAALGVESVSVDDLILQAALADSLHALGSSEAYDVAVAAAFAAAQEQRERGQQQGQPKHQQGSAALELLASFMGDEGAAVAKELSQVAGAAAASFAQAQERRACGMNCRGSTSAAAEGGGDKSQCGCPAATTSGDEGGGGGGGNVNPLVELLSAVASMHLGGGNAMGKGFGKGFGKGLGKGKGCGKGKGFGKGWGKGFGCGSRAGDYDSKTPPSAHHFGVSCDKSGMNPIVGARYSVQGANYDVCESEFAKLPEAERMLFVKIDHPGAAPVPCMGGEPQDEGAGAAEEQAPPVPPSAASNSSLAAGSAPDDEYTFVFGGGSDSEKERAIAATEEAAADKAEYEAKAASAATEDAAAAKAAATEKEAASEASAAMEAKYGAELAELSALGFYDRDANLVLLERYQGRLDRTLNALLDSSLN